MNKDDFRKEIFSQYRELTRVKKNIEKLKERYEKELPVRVGDICTLISDNPRENGRKVRVEAMDIYFDGIQCGKWRPSLCRFVTKKGDVSKRLTWISFGYGGVEKNGVRYLSWQS